MRCWISLACDLNRRRSLFEGVYVFCSKSDSRASEVFFQPQQLGRAWNWNNPWRLGKQPREGDLSGCSLLLFRELGDDIDESLIRFAIVFAEARHHGAEVGADRISWILVDLAGEETFAEWAERNEADAEFFKRRA